MSCQKGNISRQRPQKHQNRTAFKNNLHDTSHRTKFINSIQVGNVCSHCKEVIEWKIKYKKYKPLSQPKTCIKCNQRTVRTAYHVICKDCAKAAQVCCKCCKKEEIIPAASTKSEENSINEEMKALIKSLPERKRRTFLRYMDKMKNSTEDENKPSEDKQKQLMDKLGALQLDDDDLDLSDFDNSEDVEGSEEEK